MHDCEPGRGRRQGEARSRGGNHPCFQPAHFAAGRAAAQPPRAREGLVPAWKGEVVHPGAPESQCAYRGRFYRVLPVLSFYEIHRTKATD
jgi:hypothetical protein